MLSYSRDHLYLEDLIFCQKFPGSFFIGLRSHVLFLSLAGFSAHFEVFFLFLAGFGARLGFMPVHFVRLFLVNTIVPPSFLPPIFRDCGRNFFLVRLWRFDFVSVFFHLCIFLYHCDCFCAIGLLLQLIRLRIIFADQLYGLGFD